METTFENAKRNGKRVLDGWVNVYRDYVGTQFNLTQYDADQGASHDRNRIACVHVVQEYEVEE